MNPGLFFYFSLLNQFLLLAENNLAHTEKKRHFSSQIGSPISFAVQLQKQQCQRGAGGARTTWAVPPPQGQPPSKLSLGTAGGHLTGHVVTLQHHVLE